MATDAVADFIDRLDTVIIEPLIILLFGLALLVFLWGLVEFVRSAESDDGREAGKRHMVWGIVGMVIMVGARAIIEIGLRTFDVSF